jgi:cytochrome P450 family 4
MSNSRFAMMEEKVLVSSVLRKYNLQCNLKPEDMPILAEVILRPKHGIQISFSRRAMDK